MNQILNKYFLSAYYLEGFLSGTGDVERLSYNVLNTSFIPGIVLRNLLNVGVN